MKPAHIALFSASWMIATCAPAFLLDVREVHAYFGRSIEARSRIPFLDGTEPIHEQLIDQTLSCSNQASLCERLGAIGIQAADIREGVRSNDFPAQYLDSLDCTRSHRHIADLALAGNSRPGADIGETSRYRSFRSTRGGPVRPAYQLLLAVSAGFCALAKIAMPTEKMTTPATMAQVIGSLGWRAKMTKLSAEELQRGSTLALPIDALERTAIEASGGGGV